MTIFVRNPYNYDTDVASEESGLHCEDPSLAQQHEKDDADINVIMERFMKTGEIPKGTKAPVYGDFTAITDYRTALHAVKNAEDGFMALPAKIRNRFNNDPQEYLEFCTDPKNVQEMIEMGLAVEIKPAEPATGSPGGGADGQPAQPAGNPS